MSDFYECIYYGELRCECGWSYQLDDDDETDEARRIWDEHVQTAHSGEGKDDSA